VTNLDAANLASGTIPVARLFGITSNQIDSATDAAYRYTPTPVTNHAALTNLSYATSGHTGFQPAGNYVTNAQTGVTLAGTFSGAGTGLTGLNANNLAAGTVSVARLSGITTNQMASIERDKVALAVTNGQNGVRFSGTTTLTNLLVGEVVLDKAMAGTPTFIALDMKNSLGTNSPEAVFALENTAVKLLEIKTKTATNSLKTRMAIQLDTGNVGIGTTSPSAMLDVNGSALIRTNLTVSGTTTLANMLVNGKVGIGTTDPWEVLHVKGPSGVGELIQASDQTNGTSANIFFKVSSNTETSYKKGAIMFVRSATGGALGNMHFAVNGTLDSSNATVADSKVTIAESGNVGIGTNSPSAGLHVAGTVRVDGAARFNNGIVYSPMLGDITMGAFTNAP
jgi:hypothetical protein